MKTRLLLSSSAILILLASLTACGRGGSASGPATNEQGRPALATEEATIEVTLESGTKVAGCVPAQDDARGVARGELLFMSDVSVGHARIFINAIEEIKVEDRDDNTIYVRTAERSELRTTFVNDILVLRCKDVDGDVSINTAEIRSIAIQR